MNWTVVLIARNEIKTLPRLIESLHEFQRRGGAIIVVDTGSTDRTPDMARSLGCTVFEEGDRFMQKISPELAKKINKHFEAEAVPPEGATLFDYSAARNYAATLAQTDMICMPDCDELFTAYDLDEITKAIESGAEQLEYNFIFSHDEFGNEAIKFLHSKFYDRRKLHWEGIVHEVLQGQAKRQWLPENIIKLEHFQNQDTVRSGYLIGLALDCYTNPDKDRQSHYFGRELMYQGQYSAAIKELERHVAMDKWPQERAQSLNFIGECWTRLGNEAKALESWHRAFAIDSTRRESLLRLACFYWAKNDHQRAACFASAALQIPKSNFYADDQEDYGSKPHEILYWAYWYLGDRAKSAEHFDEAFLANPKKPKLIHDQKFFVDFPKVSIILPTLGRPEGLKRCLDSIENLDYPKEKIEVLVYDGDETVPEKVAKGYKESTGEWIVYAANDMEFQKNTLLAAVACAKSTGKSLIAFHEGPIYEDEGNICTHFMIRNRLVSAIGGEIFDTRYHHVGVDNLLWAKAKKLGQAAHCMDAIVDHRHFSKDEVEFDEVYRRGWKKKDEDRKRLAEDLQLLKI